VLSPEPDRDTRYRGVRSASGSRVIREDSSGAVVFASDVDSDWGIDSPKAEHLAFVILADACGLEEASAFFQDFKFDVVIELEDQWELTAADITGWLQSYLDD
jgi:hypothetical protein